MSILLFIRPVVEIKRLSSLFACLYSGLAIVFAEDVASIARDDPPPPGTSRGQGFRRSHVVNDIFLRILETTLPFLRCFHVTFKGVEI